jgi:hypothetical protein
VRSARLLLRFGAWVGPQAELKVWFFPPVDLFSPAFRWFWVQPGPTPGRRVSGEAFWGLLGVGRTPPASIWSLGWATSQINSMGSQRIWTRFAPLLAVCGAARPNAEQEGLGRLFWVCWVRSARLLLRFGAWVGPQSRSQVKSNVWAAPVLSRFSLFVGETRSNDVQECCKGLFGACLVRNAFLLLGIGASVRPQSCTASRSGRPALLTIVPCFLRFVVHLGQTPSRGVSRGFLGHVWCGAYTPFSELKPRSGHANQSGRAIVLSI